MLQSGRLPAILVALLLVAAACGGDDDAGGTAEPSGDDGSAAVTSDEPVDTTPDEATTDGGAVEGALVSVLSFDFGLWALDPAGGEAVALSVPDTGYSDRLEPVRTTPDGSRAYTLVYTQVEGQSFTNRVGLGEIDLSDGSGRLVAELGQDRADDDATDLTSWEVLGVADDTVWITELADGMTTVLAVDPLTDSVTAAVAPAEDQVRTPVVAGGWLYAQVDGRLVVLGDGGWDPVIDFADLGPDATFDAASVGDFAITRSGAPLSAEFIDNMMIFFEPRPALAGLAAVGDLLYWHFNETVIGVDGELAIIGGFVEFDPASAEVLRAWPIGPSIGDFLGENEIATSSQGSWHVADGVLWFADARDDGDLLRLDPASSGVTAFDITPSDGADYTRIELVPNDPDGVWLLVEDWTITSDDESGRTATGETRFQLLDPVSGDAMVTIPETDLTGF